ncbi:16807_t:CDS:2, partial [Cetraspora pellucida]
TEIDYEQIKDKVSYICGKFEPTIDGKLYAQIYMQFHKYKYQTIKSTKEIFNDRSMSFPTKLKGNSDQNHAYAMKDFDYCKIHPDCTCDFFDLNKICDQCDSTCEYGTERETDDINEL